MERHHLSVVFSVMGLLATELHQGYITCNLLFALNLLLQPVQFFIEKPQQINQSYEILWQLSAESPCTADLSFPVLCSLWTQKKFLWMTTLTFTIDNEIVMDIETCVSQQFVFWSQEETSPVVMLFLRNKLVFPLKHLILVPISSRFQTRWITWLIWCDHSQDVMQTVLHPLVPYPTASNQFSPTLELGSPALCFLMAFVFL